MKIDVHSHFIPRECLGLTDAKGRTYGPTIGKDASGQEVMVVGGRSFGPIISQLCDPERRLRDIERMGLDMQVISILPFSFFYDIDPDLCLTFCRRANDGIAQIVRAYPGKFVGIATVPMQNVRRAIPELERSVECLGLRGVEIGSNIAGKNLDEQEFWPFYAKVQALDVPIYVHPTNVAGADRMQKYWLRNLVGNPLETSLAIGNIIFGGILEDFPELKFLFSHAGGFVPFIRGRLDQGYRAVAECQSIPKPPSEYLKLMYFDTVIFFGPALAYLVDTVGPHRVVLGSDYPFDMMDLDPVATVRNAPAISPASKEMILGRNAFHLLKLTG